MSLFILTKSGQVAVSILNRVLSGIIWLYSGIIGLWFVLRLIFADHIWWLGLVNALAIYLFLPLGILLPLALVQMIIRLMVRKRAGQNGPRAEQLAQKPRWWRYARFAETPRVSCMPRGNMPRGNRSTPFLLPDRLPFMVLSIPLAIFIGFWGKQLIPPGFKAPARTEMTFEVMTFNTLFNNRDTAKIAEMLAVTQPDILALQEIHPKNRDAVLTALADYPYSIYHPNPDKHTIGLVSRFPIVSAEPLPYPPLKRGLRVIIDVDGQPLQVIVTHLTPNLIKHRSWPQYIEATDAWFEQRDREMALITQEIGDRPYPTLLLCDCNMTRTSQNYRDLSRHMADGFRDTGWGFGWSVFHPAFSFPIIRFDYVWHTKELQVVRSSVGPDANSDHYPVTATVQFRP